MAMDAAVAGFGASGAAGAQAGPWTNNDAALTSAQAHESLPQFIDLILGKTQEAMEAATAAAGEAMHLMASAQQQEQAGCATGAQLQQQSYLAAEAAMESAENALAVAVRLLQDTQQLVLTQQGRGLRPMPAQLQAALQQQQLQDPDLQDTCDSLAASMCTFSAHSCSSSAVSR